ncbi:hypothetical protein [Acaryochloris sp. IP29b_bin.137]|uniref:hypothetical protein n=1 Tax=Acaryochloris sp. IP29b_bin.137 TaxID=2969217 RepID=UPI0026302A01|nr:hypothetical protein [Acaryochloris sp. IP29b_bin.137]
MSHLELLTVEDVFQITGRGVVVVPDFSVPDQWVEHEEVVTIHTTSGDQREATAYFERIHLQLSDPNAPVDRRWRIVVTFRDLSKEQVPLGSRIFASRDICELLVSPLNKSIQMEPYE